CAHERGGPRQRALWLVSRSAPLWDGASCRLWSGLRANGGLCHGAEQCARRDPLSANARERAVLTLWSQSDFASARATGSAGPAIARRSSHDAIETLMRFQPIPFTNAAL